MLMTMLMAVMMMLGLMVMIFMMAMVTMGMIMMVMMTITMMFLRLAGQPATARGMLLRTGQFRLQGDMLDIEPLMQHMA